MWCFIAVNMVYLCHYDELYSSPGGYASMNHCKEGHLQGS